VSIAVTNPSATVYAPVDLCNSTKGRLMIQTDGTATVSADGGTWSNAQCFTSLDGVSYLGTGAGASALTLKNNWTTTGFGTRVPSAVASAGVVRLMGAAANGTSGTILTLPPGMRPTASVYAGVDLCGAAKGRVIVSTNGDVTVTAGEGAFSNASCFTSLEGVFFAQ